MKTIGTERPDTEVAVILGVDTHLHFHVAVAVDNLGRHLGEARVPTTVKGYEGLLSWAEDFGPVRCAGVEGTSSYGAGLVVFDIDYRLSPPPSWREAPADVACAVGWVKDNAARYGVDPERVALMGRSAGAQLALLTAYEGDRAAPTPGCAAGNVGDAGVAAVVGFYSPTDLPRLSSEGYLPGMHRFLGGSPDAVPGRYRNLSPVSHVDPGDPPTFLAYGGDDRIVPPGQSGLLGERLRDAGMPHRLVELPWANHTFDFLWGGWGSQITRSTLKEFLERHL